jgi:hypothetical protein
VSEHDQERERRERLKEKIAFLEAVIEESYYSFEGGSGLWVPLSL